MVQTIRLELARSEDAGDPHAFRTGPQEYILRWQGGTFEAARLHWDDALLHDLVALREPGSGPELVRRVGLRLQRFLEPTRFREVAAELSAALAGRIRLEVVSGAAELYALPWELLTLPDGRHLGELPDLSIAYQWPGAAAARPARDPRPEGGRIVVAWSRAFGNVGEVHTIAAIAAAARAGFVAFDREQDVLGDISLAGLVEALERRVAGPDPPAILHLLAHGAARGEAYGLGLDDGRGGREVVDAAALRRALAPFAGHLRLVVLMACDSENPGPPGALLGGAAQELHRAGFEAVIGSRAPVGGGAALELTRGLYTALLEQTCSVEQAFVAARTRLARGSGLEWASLMLYGHALECRPIVFRPHRGLLAFEREHARFFFGRDAERREAIADLTALIAARRSRFLVVAGASGTGKSSVVLAGVVPDVERMGWSFAVMRPGRDPGRALEEALSARPQDGRPWLLVVDQFEELFTHAAAGTDPSAFARRLWDLSQQSDSHTQVLLTLRVDYLGRCGEVMLDDAGLRLDRVAYDEAFRVFVAQMTPDKLAETIEGPIGRVGLSLEPGLGRRLLDEIGRDPVGLPLLQYALDELWKRRQGDVLTHAALDAIGGVVGAMTRHAEAIWSGLPPAEQLQARRLLVRLVAYGSEPGSGTRRREVEAELRPARDAAAWDRVVGALIDARLLIRREEPEGRATLEVAHEALIRHWDRLWRWYEEDRLNLARARELAQVTAQARQHGQLLTGNLLVHAEALVRALGDDADADARALVGASRAAEDRARRLVRLVRISVWVGLVVFTLVVLRLRRDAVVAAARAQDGARLASALRELAARPHVAAAILREIEGVDIPQWRQAAFVATQAPLPAAVVRLDPGDARPGAITAVALGPDGRELVVGHADGSLRIWSLTSGTGPTGQPLLLAPGPTRGEVEEIIVQPAPGGSTILARGVDLALWRRTGDAIEPVFRQTFPPDRPALRVARNPSSGRIAVDGGLAGMSFWTPEGGALRQAGPDCAGVALDPGAELVVCLNDAGLELSSWTSRSQPGKMVSAPLADQPISAGAALYLVPAAPESGPHHLVVDRERGLLLSVPDERMDAILGPTDLLWTACGDTNGIAPSADCRLCRRPRDGSHATICAALPRDCLKPSLRDLHAELGALVQCREPTPQLLLAVVPAPRLTVQDPHRIGEPLAEVPIAPVRHTFVGPGDEIQAAMLAPPDDLVAVTRRGVVWRWDLTGLPSGLVPASLVPTGLARTDDEATASDAPPARSLVPGAFALLEADAAGATGELRLLRWERPGAAPAVARTALALPSSSHYPASLVADGERLAAVFATTSWVDRRGAAAPTMPDDDAVFWGSLPPATPATAVLASGDPLIDLTPAALAGSALVVSAEDTVDLVDLADPARARVRVRSPTYELAPGDVRPERLVAAAVHPRGLTAALAWKSRAVLVDRGSGREVDLPRDEAPGCGDVELVDPVTALAYAPDGARLAVGFRSGRLALMSLGTDGNPDGSPVASRCSPHAAITALTFTAGGARVLSGDAAGGITIWPDDQAGAGDEPILVEVPGRPELRALTVVEGRAIVALTGLGDLWYTHATFDAAGLVARLKQRSTTCLAPSERENLLLEDAARAAELAAACAGRSQ